MIRAVDNPFRAQRLDAIEYIPQNEPLDVVCGRLKSMDFTAAVIGPHGSGKSTLLGSVQQYFDVGGYGTSRLFISRDVKLRWKTVIECVKRMRSSDVLFFDGANHFPLWRFHQLRWTVRKRGIGLVITSHTEGLLPTLVHCRTNTDLLAKIVNRLLPDESIDPSRIEMLFHAHDGNIRDCLWQLYDEYQRHPIIS